MRSLFFIFLFVVIFGALNINGVMASGFSPSSLVFDLKPGQQDCKMITLDSDSPKISLSDKWAENDNVEWQINLFEKNAGYHGIDIDYPSELTEGENQAEVCLSGSRIGEYHGILLLEEEQEGNSIIQMGVWMKVTISNNPAQQQKSSDSESSSSGESSSIVYNSNEQLSDSSESSSEGDSESESDSQKEGTTSGITGSAIGDNSGSRNWKTLGILFVVLVAGIFIFAYNKRRNSL